MNNTITLENSFISVTIHPLGAELQSLIFKQTGIEYIWNREEKFWNKCSPVLFPIIGSVKDDTYYYKDKAYHLPRHGFAREFDFTPKVISETELLFTLTSSNATLADYPFEFELGIRYILSGATITCQYEVQNTGSDEMFFSIGGHPAFNVPYLPNTNYNDYYLTFNKDEKLERYKLTTEGLIINKTEPVQLVNGNLQLEYHLFYEDAIVLKKLNSNCISLKNNINSNGLHFHFNDFPFFGIWAQKNAPFVCLEPWCGIADAESHDQDFKTKEGIVNLRAKELFKRAWAVECF